MERYHWSIAEVAQIDDADPNFMWELITMLEVITGERIAKEDKAGFKARSEQRMASLRGKR